jgi:hypothetical protein
MLAVNNPATLVGIREIQVAELDPFVIARGTRLKPCALPEVEKNCVGKIPTVNEKV